MFYVYYDQLTNKRICQHSVDNLFRWYRLSNGILENWSAWYFKNKKKEIRHGFVIGLFFIYNRE